MGPGVRKRELVLDGRIHFLDLPQALPQAGHRAGGGFPFSIRAGPGEKGFHPAQFFDELFFFGHQDLKKPVG